MKKTGYFLSALLILGLGAFFTKDQWAWYLEDDAVVEETVVAPELDAAEEAGERLFRIDPEQSSASYAIGERLAGQDRGVAVGGEIGMSDVVIQPLSAEAFAPFGEVLDCAGEPAKRINQGLCGRYHDRATLDLIDGRAGISLFRSEVRDLPYRLDMVERHPEGSQAFIPMSMDPFLVIVAPDEEGVPGVPLAFETPAGQAVNFHKGTWHGVLTPLAAPGLFAVVDRIGNGPNLEEHWFDTPYSVAPITQNASTGLA